jgi:2-methylcitrate dehydratase PrpD
MHAWAGGVIGATSTLAAFVVTARESALPAGVVHEAVRCFQNFVGCAIGGTSHDLFAIASRALMPFSGPSASTVVGRGLRADPLLASLLNGAAASAHSFDDTHAQVIVHPGAPVCAAALAAAELRQASGRQLLAAVALGAEAMCRVSKAVSLEAAADDVAWYQTGITGGLGAAVAAGTLLGLDATRMRSAIGIAVAHASGSRVHQGYMTMLMLAGHAAQCGVRAALLAEAGMEAPPAPLEDSYGFVDVFARRPFMAALTSGLGDDYEILRNTYKAYPCGIVLHPVVDACFEILTDHRFDAAAIRAVTLRMHPAAVGFTDRPFPTSRSEAQVSAQHWAAVALSRGSAGLDDGTPAAIADPVVAQVRGCVELQSDPELARDQAQATVLFANGARVSSALRRGCMPMSDEALARKFDAQASTVFDARRALHLRRAIDELPHAASLDALSSLL